MLRIVQGVRKWSLFDIIQLGKMAQMNDLTVEAKRMQSITKETEAKVYKDKFKYPKSFPVVLNKLEKIILWIIVFFLMSTGLLTLCVTAYFPDYNYHILFASHSFKSVSVLCILTIIGLGVLDYLGILRRINTTLMTQFLFIYVFIFGCFWMILAKVWPEWDSAEILTAAQMLPDTNSWFFTDAGYFIRFPFQIPVLYFDRLMIYVFGNSAYEAIEFVNVICSATTVLLLVKLSEAISNDKRTVNITILLCCTFFPLMFYVTFAYPNVLCFPFLIGAFLSQILHIKKKENKYAVLAIASAVICVVLKSSMLLLIISMTVVWILCAIREKRIAKAICAFCLILTYFMAGQVLGYISKTQLNIDPADGLPKTVWIAMGLQSDGAKDPNNFGWYNGYPWSWNSDQYNVRNINEESKKLIRKSVDKFVSDPKYALSFFAKKYSSEWAEPTFESLLASNWSKGRQIPGTPIMSKRPMTKFLHSIYYGKANGLLMRVMDTWQTLVLFGAAIALIRSRNREIVNILAPGMFALGTAILFLFWETQSQYILPAYVAIVPYVGVGLMYPVKYVSSFIGFVVEQTRRKLNIAGLNDLPNER